MSFEVPAGWERLPLGEVLTLQRGFDLPKLQRHEGSVPVVSSSGVSGSHSEAKVLAPGVVTGRYGTIGQVFFVTEDFWPLNTTLWVKDFKGNDPAFAARLLQSIDFHAYSDKTSVPGVNRNHLHTAEVTLPPYAEQVRIAAVLGALDRAADQASRTSKRLEALISALFREAVATQTDWVEGDLTSLARFVNGKNFTKGAEGTGRPVLRIKELRSGVSDATVRSETEAPDDFVAGHFDLLFAWSGTLGVHRWDGPEGLVNQHIFKVVPQEGIPLWFVESWLNEHIGEFASIARDKATTMGHIQRRHLSEAMVLIPEVGGFAALHARIGPLDAARQLRAREAARLRDIRDAIIPKLINGKLRVAEDYLAGLEEPVAV